MASADRRRGGAGEWRRDFADGARAARHDSVVAGSSSKAEEGIAATHNPAGEPRGCIREPYWPSLEGRIMAVSEPPVIPIKRMQTAKNGRWSGYVHLLLARLRELQREPEVVFWVFVFPLLLAVGLGVAFRNKPADVTAVVVVASPQAGKVVEMLHEQQPSMKVKVLEREMAKQAFRLGKYDLVVEPRAEGVQYDYDPARTESVLAHEQVNNALQVAAGRKDVLPANSVASSEPGSRYIDFLIPGLLGMNLMNSGMWGIGFALVDMRQRKLLKGFVATPMRRSDFLLALTSSRLVLMIIEVGLLLGFGILFFHMRVTGSIPSILL